MKATTIILTFLCLSLLSACERRQGELALGRDVELRGLLPDKEGANAQWIVLADAAQIQGIIPSKGAAGKTELWLDFSSANAKRISRLLERRNITRFRFLAKDAIVADFDCDVRNQIGRLRICVRLDSSEEAMRIVKTLTK